MSVNVLPFARVRSEDSRLPALNLMEFDRVNPKTTPGRDIRGETSFGGIVGRSAVLRQVLQLIEMVGPSDATVLLLGETGTGKELVAKAIHTRSQRHKQTLVTVSCSAIPGPLFESELFGHERGAFTGAYIQKAGRLELANRGTLFLDEVGDLPLELQPKLLRTLQERTYERLGSARTKSVDVRLVAATNCDLGEMMAEGRFRSDLYYRLNVFPICVPPLRERRADVPLLVEHFTNRFASRAGKSINRISKKTLSLLESHDWPGNIRELQNLVERAVILSETDALYVDEQWLSGRQSKPRVTATPLPRPQHPSTLANQEKAAIEAALTETKGRVSGPFGAASRLGIPSSTLESKIKALHIDKRRFKAAVVSHWTASPTFKQG
jgi:formate hydrogenlyase transcriptional activator